MNRLLTFYRFSYRSRSRKPELAPDPLSVPRGRVVVEAS